jgi:hypothetical protein
VLLAIWIGGHELDLGQMIIRPNLFDLTRRAARSFNVAACALALASCATVTRIPYTQQEHTAAVIPEPHHRYGAPMR